MKYSNYIKLMFRYYKRLSMPNLALGNYFIKIAPLLFTSAFFLCIRGIALASMPADIANHYFVTAVVNIWLIVFIILAIGAIYTGTRTGAHDQNEANLFLALTQFLTLFIFATATLLTDLYLLQMKKTLDSTLKELALARAA